MSERKAHFGRNKIKLFFKFSPQSNTSSFTHVLLKSLDMIIFNFHELQYSTSVNTFHDLSNFNETSIHSCVSLSSKLRKIESSSVNKLVHDHMGRKSDRWNRSKKKGGIIEHGIVCIHVLSNPSS